MLKQAAKSSLEGRCPWECVTVDGKSMGAITKPVAGKMIQGKIGKYPAQNYPQTTEASVTY